MIWKVHMHFMLLLLSLTYVFCEDESTPSVLNSEIEEEQQLGPEEAVNIVLSDNTNDNEPIDMPKPSKKPSRHHSKNRNHEMLKPDRSAVYDVVNEPCFSPGCRGGYGPFDAGQGGYRWQSRGNRMVPYPNQFYDPRRRGMYPPSDYYQDGYYGYGPRDQDYGYGSRGSIGYQGRYGSGFGGYTPQAGGYYGNRILG
ncbi:uncharacterized protein [Parasteatoda tepidariorum]|uniref:uncharacterized protein n=1 Tax=Parasteatoda tepidariorum TaxID=114398 RepID=UPI00077F97DD|nr:heterogeneous nuclear ribonucleoproteins A2/B1-like [Parasteatoda tepidariorum]